MNRFALLILCMFYSMATIAADFVAGTINPVRTEMKIAVTLDCSECVYKTRKKDLPFEFYLATESRRNDWQEKSLECFIKDFNGETLHEGLLAVLKTDNNDIRYELKIKPTQIWGNGDLKGKVYIVDLSNNKIIAVFTFHEDGDDEDRCAICEPLTEVGEDVGEYFKKLKKGGVVTSTMNICDSLNIINN